MRRVPALFVLGLVSLASGAELKIDHATVAGTGLDAMRQAFTAATGIPTEYGGPHSNHLTEMAVVSFPDGSYLELMGLAQRSDPAGLAAHPWGRFLRDNAGPCAFALRAADVGAEVARFKSEGIRVGAAEKSGRTRPDGVALSWETAELGPGPRGSFFPFLIRDFTPRENRVYPSGKPTSTRFGGIGLVVIGVHDPEGSIAQYRKAFRLPAPKRQRDESFGADLAWFEGTPVVLAGWFGARILAVTPDCAIWRFSLRVRSHDQSRDVGTGSFEVVRATDFLGGCGETRLASRCAARFGEVADIAFATDKQYFTVYPHDQGALNTVA